MRGVAQRISYEVRLSLVLVGVVYLSGVIMLQEIAMCQELFMFSIFMWPFIPVWLVCILAETNRAPFDFVEGESELVSGFNVEYRGRGFAIIFMAEYRRILFNRLLSGALFFGGVRRALMVLLSMGVVFFYVWVRGSLPRLRYDKLIGLA